MNREMSDLVGPDREPVVDSHLSQNKKNIEDRTEALIARARQRISQHRAGTMTAKMAAEWNSVGNLTAHMTYQTPVECPACDLEGVLEGDEEFERERERTVRVGETSYEQLEYDYDYPTFTLTISADYFSCPHCHLVLDRLEFVEQARLPVAFEIEGGRRQRVLRT